MGAGRRLVQTFFRQNKGNIAIMFAVSLPLVLGLSGGVVELAELQLMKQSAQTAVDAAALAVAKRQNEIFLNTGQEMTADDISTYARAFVAMNGRGRFDDTAVNVEQYPASHTVKVRVDGTIRSQFLQVIGITELAYSAEAVAQQRGPQFFQILFFIDVSNSMAVGASQADVERFQKWSGGCAFTCHTSNDGLDAMALARRQGMKLKMDYVRDALQTFKNKIEPLMQKHPGQYFAGVHTFGSRFQRMRPMTSVAWELERAIQTVEVEVAFEQPDSAANLGYTYIEDSMLETGKLLASIGDGSSAAKRKTFVVIMTDGIQDTKPPSWVGRMENVNYTNGCETLKKSGAEIFTIQTYYPYIDQYFEKIRNAVPDVLRSCASGEDNYMLADDGKTIVKSADWVFSEFSRELRLVH